MITIVNDDGDNGADDVGADDDNDLYEDLLAAVGVPHTGRHVLVVGVARQLV